MKWGSRKVNIRNFYFSRSPLLYYLNICNSDSIHKFYLLFIYLYILYISFNFLQNSTLHIARSLCCPSYITFSSRGIKSYFPK